MPLFRFRLSRRTSIIIGCLCFVFAVALLFGSNIGRQVVGRVTARLTLGSRPLNILLIANNARGVAADDPLGLGTAAGQADVILLAHVEPATLHLPRKPRARALMCRRFPGLTPKEAKG